MTTRSPSLATRRPGPGPRPRAAAFTLVELLVVISVIAILAAMLLTGVFSGRISAKIETTRSLVTQVSAALEQFRMDHGALLPETASGMVSSECLAQGLGIDATYIILKKSLTTDFDGDGKPELCDSFGQPLVYNRWCFHDGDDNLCDSVQPVHNPKSYDLFSVGAYANKTIALVPGPNLVLFETNAVAHAANATRYTNEEITIGNTVNKYIGNW